jgi:hypothetical protein
VDYGEIIGSAWRMTWRYRGLWLVGLFAGGASGSCGISSGGGGSPEDIAQSLNRSGATLELSPALAGLGAILPGLIAIGVVVFLIWLLFWLLSVACKAAVIAGGGEAATGAVATLGMAWSRGLRSFVRLFELELLWLVFWLIVIGLVGLYGASAVGGRQVDVVTALTVLFNVLGILTLVGVIGSLLGIVLAFAERAIVLNGAGAIRGIGAAFGLIRQRFGQSFLLWLIGLTLSIGGGIAVAVGLFVAALPSLLVGAILGFLASLGGANGLAVALVVCGVLLLVVLLIASAALNTFLWHYWTSAYLRLTGALARATEPMPPVPAPLAEPS